MVLNRISRLRSSLANRVSTSARIRAAILIVGSGTCSSCQADLPFEEKLWEASQREAIPVYYILVGRDSNRSRIAELRSGGRTVIVIQSAQQFGISRVPTIVRVDSRPCTEQMDGKRAEKG
jgi:hypothetical protein